MSIIFIASGLTALESVSDAAHHDPYDALTGVPLVAPYSGDKGLLSDEQFETKKAQILSRM